MVQDLVNGVLNENRAHSCLQFRFQLVIGLYGSYSSLFLRVCLP